MLCVRVGVRVRVCARTNDRTVARLDELERVRVLMLLSRILLDLPSLTQATSTSTILLASARACLSPDILIDLKRCSGVCLNLSFATAEAPASRRTSATAGLPAMWSGVWQCFVEAMFTSAPFSMSQRTQSSLPDPLAACSDECPFPPGSRALTSYSTRNSSSSVDTSPLAAALRIFWDACRDF